MLVMKLGHFLCLMRYKLSNLGIRLYKYASKRVHHVVFVNFKRKKNQKFAYVTKAGIQQRLLKKKIELKILLSKQILISHY